MGNNKIIKSAAAVALTASVVATAAAPQASAAAYKVNKKDQLVSSTTGKLVKGWKVFGGKLYKNGKLAPAKKYKIIGTGAAQRLYYGPTLKKGYKTANSKTLLFKDGKLADGWKQAGKNERLYKNGKLDKGYTVYTNVEGDKFLYQNGKLKKGDKTATRGGETLLFTDGLLSKGVKEFKGKTYNNGKLANGLVNGKEYENGVLVSSIESAKAINSTTVEVTFKKAVKATDIKAENFTIEGLTVTNAAVKQTDDKTVVLTTSKQEAAKEYTVAYAGETAKFTALNDAIPTAITTSLVQERKYQTSQQAQIGTQVTVKAQVTVAEGQSKAGIPVTFNIDNTGSTDAAAGNFGEDKKNEAVTDENGVATFTYTQYGTKASEDEVIAYPTGAPTQRTSTKVYWGVKQMPLTVNDVTTEATLANNGKKVYKVTGDVNAKYYVTFAENYEVTPDAVNKKAQVNDDNVSPFQSSISGKPVSSKVVEIETNAAGEATFTVTGSDTAVTPVVFKATSSAVAQADRETSIRLAPTALQVTASKVTFENVKTVGLTNDAQGTKNASAAKDGVTFDKMKENQGGRTYVATLTDNNGKTAAAGTKVYLDLNKSGVTNNTTGATTPVFHVFDADGKVAKKLGANLYELTTDKNGQVKYAISTPTHNSYVTPIVFLDNANNVPNGKYDEADTHKEGEITYFGDAAVSKAVLKFNTTEGNLTVKNDNKVTVNYQTVDQNGFEYAPEKETKVTFNFTSTFGKLTATKGDKETVVVTGNTNNKALEFTTDAKGEIEFVLTTDIDTTATVTASGNTVVANNVTGTVVFDKVGQVATTTVTAAELAAVNAATTKDAIETALANNDAYKALTKDQKDALVADLLKELTAGKSYNGAQLAAKLDAAKGNTTAPETQVKTTELETAIKDAKAALETVPAANKEALEAAIKTAEAALAAKESQEKVDTATKDLTKAVEDAKKEDVKEVTAKELGTVVKVLDGLYRVDVEKTKLTGDLAVAEGQKLVLVSGEKTVGEFEQNPNEEGLLSAVVEDLAQADVEAAIVKVVAK